MTLSRRALFSAGAAAATTAAFTGYARFAAAQTTAFRNEVEGFGPLRADPLGVFDLPEGFSYRIISQAGETMSDGLLVPHKADGMAAFALPGGRVGLVRNHELRPSDVHLGPFGYARKLAGRVDPGLAYDVGKDGAALPGGTTTMVYDVRAGRLVSQHLSLLGTVVNCAGGATPWGSWLTCEETVLRPGESSAKAHGYVFEVPVGSRRLEARPPITGMGRFRHEAVAIDPRTGIAYLTEDEGDGLFYRYLPNDRRRLQAGGRLQALAIQGRPGADTRNWSSVTWKAGDRLPAVWIDLEGVDNPHNDLKARGHAKGAALFARGEGIHLGADGFYLTCTSGGPAKIGQILRYRPSEREGQAGEAGALELFVESADKAVLDYADNLTAAPWGDLIVCEDKLMGSNGLKGVTPEGRVYTIGRNAMPNPPGQPVNTELAGVCFSPDGSTMFLNLYWPGLTLAITGPWSRRRV
jgi:hypothetical protein